MKFTGTSASWTIGPADSFEFRGAEMLFPGQPEPVARYHNAWVVDGKRSTYAECRSMVSIQFEDDAGRVGPVIGLRTAFYLRGLYAFAGRERIAKLDPVAGVWWRTGTREQWACMRIVSAPLVRR